MPTPLSDALAWAVIALFLGGTLLDLGDRRALARPLLAGAWGVFAVFWLSLVPHFALVQRSVIEGVLSLAAVPACAYTGYLLYAGRDSLFVLSRAVPVMGLIYLPFETIEALRRPAVEMVTGQVSVLIHALGYDPKLATGHQLGYQNMFVFAEGGRRYSTEIVLACTGIGSMSIFAGLVAAVRAPLRRKLRALAIALPVIYALNVLRVTFIAVAHGDQWFRGMAGALAWAAGGPTRVSFFVADRVISQSLSVAALVIVAWLVVRELPELLTVLEDVAYLATGDEYDLRSLVSA